MTRFRALTISLVAMALTGCSDHKAQVGPQTGAQLSAQLSALDEAYKSGVFTKQEYDSKKTAIIASAPTPAATAPPAGSPPATTPDTSATPPVAAIQPAPASIPVTPVSPPPAAAAIAAPPPALSAPAPVSQQQISPAAAPPPPRSTTVAPSTKPAPIAKAVAPERPEPEPAPSRGCEDAEFNAHKNGKQSRFFAVPLDRARKSAFAALANLGFKVEKDSGNEMEASRKSGGNREILHFDATQQGGKKGTKVSAETKKGSDRGAVQKSWTSAVLAQVACGLR